MIIEFVPAAQLDSQWFQDFLYNSVSSLTIENCQNNIEVWPAYPTLAMLEPMAELECMKYEAQVCRDSGVFRPHPSLIAYKQLSG